MPLQNRVLPTGEIVADPARGTFMGNRGILHGPDRTLGTARWRHSAWICCLLQFKGRARRVMSPGRYTELFFLDEAVALAAGHRPCAECRRSRYLAFRAALAVAGIDAGSAKDLDRVLHKARIAPGRAQERAYAPLTAVPPGAFILLNGRAHLVLSDALLPFTPQGYGPPIPRPTGRGLVLTPTPICRALAHGYAPALHPTAHQ